MMANDSPTLIDPMLIEKAEQLARIHGDTRVVLSFGARNGGAYFASWLRWMIMTRKNWKQANHVYLDTECLKFAGDTKIEVKDAARPWLTGVASMNSGWKEYYRFAVRQARCMIFVATPEWTDSPYCAMEKRYFIYENYHRRRNHKRPLRGIELSMSGHRINLPMAKVINAEKVDVETHYTEQHVVSDRANHRAASNIGVTLNSPKLPKNENWTGNYAIAGQSLLQIYQEI